MAASMGYGDEWKVNVAAIETLPGDRLGWGRASLSPTPLCFQSLQESQSCHQFLCNPYRIYFPRTRASTQNYPTVKRTVGPVI